MKIISSVMSILLALFLVSCEQKEAKPQPQSLQPQPLQSQQPKMAFTGVHTVVVQEVIQVSSYTYLKVKEEENIFWVAVTKTQVEAGETISFENPMEMKNFSSRELQRTFETIYFIGRISNESSPSADKQPGAATPKQKPAIKKKVISTTISIEPAEGGISIGELFFNKNSYANKVVRIKGQVTKVNRAIMGKNWVHLQDGTGESGSDDLIITTQDNVAFGDVVIFEGTIALNRDFGPGYSYEVIMEDAKRLSD